TEIIHIGQAVMTLGGTIDYFRQNVFNHPSMAESYKVAALDGLNRTCIDNFLTDQEITTTAANSPVQESHLVSAGS
ncbi:MAG: Si-specific NAD(P)(+) transhydrogenase, partial [Planctomycetota bacterium]